MAPRTPRVAEQSQKQAPAAGAGDGSPAPRPVMAGPELVQVAFIMTTTTARLQAIRGAVQSVSAASQERVKLVDVFEGVSKTADKMQDALKLAEKVGSPRTVAKGL